MRHETLSVTTSSTGGGTANGTRNILGKLYAILYCPGDIDTGATITVTSQGIFAKPLLTKSSAGTADTLFYPRDLSHKVADGAALTNQLELPLINGTLRLAVSAGASTKTGKVVVYYED
jgi:hypothetical protein